MNVIDRPLMHNVWALGCGGIRRDDGRWQRSVASERMKESQGRTENSPTKRDDRCDNSHGCPRPVQPHISDGFGPTDLALRLIHQKVFVRPLIDLLCLEEVALLLYPGSE